MSVNLLPVQIPNNSTVSLSASRGARSGGGDDADFRQSLSDVDHARKARDVREGRGASEAREARETKPAKEGETEKSREAPAADDADAPVEAEGAENTEKTSENEPAGRDGEADDVTADEATNGQAQGDETEQATDEEGEVAAAPVQPVVGDGGHAAASSNAKNPDVANAQQSAQAQSSGASQPAAATANASAHVTGQSATSVKATTAAQSTAAPPTAESTHAEAPAPLLAAQAEARNGDAQANLNNAGQQSSSQQGKQAQAAATLNAALSAAPALTADASSQPIEPVAQPSAPPPAQPAPSANTTAQPAAQNLPTDDTALRDAGNIGRTARALQTAVNQRGGSITLRLSPPELGALRIDMTVRDGAVTARFTAQQESVRHLLQDHMSQLRHALDRQGLTVERIDVQTSAQSSNASLNQHADDAWTDGRSRDEYARGQSGGNAQQQQGESKDGERRATTFEELVTEASG